MLFSVYRFSLCLSPPGGKRHVLKNHSAVIVILWFEQYFIAFFSPFPDEGCKFGVCRRNWEMEKGKGGRENSLEAGICYAHSYFTSSHPAHP